MAREGRSVSVDATNSRNNSRGFPLSEACLLVGLNVVEEAVLGRGGEAAAGLLRAFRTVRNSDGGGGYQDHALAGGGRGHAEGGELSLFVAVLGQVRGVRVGKRGGNEAKACLTYFQRCVWRIGCVDDHSMHLQVGLAHNELQLRSTGHITFVNSCGRTPPQGKLTPLPSFPA